jgi:excisionase family DNA binding protein
MAIERDMKLLTASDVAELCEVDLKTIHNWVDRGCIPHFRTPGRHLRFQAVDVAGFLREWGYAIPRRFYAALAQTVLVVGGKDALAVVTRAAGQSATIRVVDDLVEAMVWIGAEPTSALVMDAAVATANQAIIEQAIDSIKRAYPIPVLLLGEDDSHLADRADVLFVPMGDSKMLRAALTGDVKDSGQIEEGILPAPPTRRRARRGRSAKA